MKKTIILLLLTAIASAVHAQTAKRDTIVLSVYNTNQLFMLHPMPFGKGKPEADFTAPMLVVLDTINVLKADIEPDSTGHYPLHWATEHSCGKRPTDSLTGKVALMYMNLDCDISTQVLMLQNAGAIAAVFIHTTNNRDSVALPKHSPKYPYADSSKVRIPCFTVRSGIGDKITMMLPSIVGIQNTKGEDVGNIQFSAIANGSNRPPNENVEKGGAFIATDTQAGQVSEVALLNTPTLGLKQSFTVSPNPVTNQADVSYSFLQPTDATIEVKTALGQVVFSQIQRGCLVGVFPISTVDYPDGTYLVSLQYGKVVQAKKIVVRR
jgi:hypothetical protein